MTARAAAACWAEASFAVLVSLDIHDRPLVAETSLFFSATVCVRFKKSRSSWQALKARSENEVGGRERHVADQRDGKIRLTVARNIGLHEGVAATRERTQLADYAVKRGIPDE